MTFSFPDNAPAWQRAGADRVWLPYTQMQNIPLPVPVVRTEGVYWELADGRRLLDGLASWWTACHGYNEPTIVGAVADQLQRMPHVMFAGVHHEPALTLAKRLTDRLPGDLRHVFFSDSGSVAVEVAMKMCVQYWRNLGQSERVRFVSFRHAYHGDTTGAMSVGDPIDSMHAHFKGFLLEQYSEPIPETSAQHAALEAFLKLHRHRLAGVIIEPLVQAAGGMKFHSADSLARIAQLCQRMDLLLIVDEIATGFGRTGTMFACEQASVVPDIMCLGKALTAGVLGMAVTVTNDRVYDAFLSEDLQHALMHGPTFMANPLACTAANASLEVFDRQPRLQQARRMETAMREQLEECRGLPHVVDVRCLGAVGVVEVDQLRHLERLRQAFIQRGVWLRPFGNVIYMMPPLVVSDAELTRLCHTVVSVVREWSQW